ncbi:fatty acyl-CoA reductase 1-like [Centruroides sculpturatus]|uniref:fatty acyl-CoA reductase 1-like n=1 Tax=Centruroides sculpturatus TaxID=218467 RepID=UPI000C6DD298|nr:fatty acyl-CoA reductase 1-like [Centruroides sculpturatus]
MDLEKSDSKFTKEKRQKSPKEPENDDENNYCIYCNKQYGTTQEKWIMCCKCELWARGCTDVENELVFGRMKEERPNYREKLHIISGDLSEPLLGISETDLDLLSSEVSIVYHVAATVRFDEALKIAVEQNLLGTKRLIEVCKRLRNLESLVHVSTAYCNCNRSEPDEIIYPSKVDPEELIRTIQWMDTDLVDTITPKLIDDFPNTYSFTKNLAEKLYLKETDLPVSIFRPTIVSPSWKEPYCGWIDSFNGPTGITVGAMKGIVRTMVVSPNKVSDVIPVDLCINMMVAIPWYTVTHKPKGLQIYQCASSTVNKVTWGDVFGLLNRPTYLYPSAEVFRYPGGSFKTSHTVHNIAVVFDHYIPAALTDALLYLSGKKPRMMSIYKKVDKAMIVFNHFSTNEWYFQAKNYLQIWDAMSDVDKKLFNFDVRSVIWNLYFENFILGVRKFMLNEDHSTLPKARKTFRKLQLRNLAVKTALLAAATHYVLNSFFSISAFDYLW